MDKTEQILKNFLNLHWIRPEVALWRTLDSIQLKKILFKKPMIDLGCGDGTFSFTLFEGQVKVDFDVYGTIKNTSGFFDGKDIQNQKAKIIPKITKNPKKKFETGIDWKKALLEKAEKLQVYDVLIKHDLNKPLPIEDKKYETVFSNIFYWVPNIDQLLTESKRILNDSGKIIILVPDKKLKDNLIFKQYIKHRYKWAKILDRGIYKNITKHAYSYSDWRKLFKKHDLKIEYHSQYLSPKFIKLWSIGMRPYSPYMIEMANKILIKEKKKIKTRLINEMTPILRSYLDMELKSPERDNCFHCFVLKN